MYLRDKPIPVQSSVIDGEVEAVEGAKRLAFMLGCGDVAYVSDTVEEDLDTGVNLLAISIEFLRMLRDYDNKISVLDINMATSLKEHIEATEDFLGQWE